MILAPSLRIGDIHLVAEHIPYHPRLHPRVQRLIHGLRRQFHQPLVSRYTSAVHTAKHFFQQLPKLTFPHRHNAQLTPFKRQYVSSNLTLRPVCTFSSLSCLTYNSLGRLHKACAEKSPVNQFMNRKRACRQTHHQFLSTDPGTRKQAFLHKIHRWTDNLPCCCHSLIFRDFQLFCHHHQHVREANPQCFGDGCQQIRASLFLTALYF
ncbi:protein [Scardovia inopinata]|uniref:Uncharacterized protein n=1 Tax=Scardovia inopinata F0304 TaxID=641146 RepID=W1MXA4_SCAIO|nr:hypothetical protein HMPREF9020_01520 [Scardovia inopinata F0304]SUV50902.1 protein [Scardovia inopinata]